MQDEKQLKNELENAEPEQEQEPEPEPEVDLPTPSYGTGIRDQPQFSTGIYDRMQETNSASPVLTGGDLDANWEQAEAVGDEAVGGTAPTPDMDVVDELGAAVGLEMDDQAFLRTSEILEQRDDHRWELDPDSAEE
ncbi:MAG: hypothetical protein KME07_04050 [Pegethrix bostrychoides GSE-TBD4-15B]|uniref:Uncharacterized protein n=1 Tax=Pegethrix bostrychoides GSE-TBD4-15B TaxID=2839662 RepID=A0A951P7P1_9CYAN|nr:hypothetical protein [Pegethrix bostrychoides GSE-TBD4-15B]